MIARELRDEVVEKARSREKKNQYTQGSKRIQVDGGWSDCSSFVRWCYLQVLGQDIGSNTAAQITNKILQNVADVNELGGKYPPEDKLLPGDLIYYKGTDSSRPRQCGHVEMYLGDGRIIGHGSGIGPTEKSLRTYSKSRYAQGKGWLCALRVIRTDEEDNFYCAPPPPFLSRKHIRVTGNTVNVRKGPGTTNDILGIAKQGQVFDTNGLYAPGWIGITYDGQSAWITTKYTEGFQ